MKRITAVTLATAVAVAGGLALAAPASAKDGDARTRGGCSGDSSFAAKVKSRDGGLRVDFWVKNNQVGQSWTYTLTQPGAATYTATKVTRANDDDDRDDSRHTAEAKFRTYRTSAAVPLTLSAVGPGGETCSTTIG